MTKVSVIIPVYNVESYLAKCLDSIINQTLKDIEIICINDCSPDNSLTILEEYAQKDNRIKIIDFKENKGVSVARNAGLKIAKGEYIGFVDPDDYIDLNFYEELYKKAIEENADIVKCPRKQYLLDGSIEIGDAQGRIQKSKDKFDFTYEWTTAIYNANIVRKYNISLPEKISHNEDVCFLFIFLLYANKLELVDTVFYHYVKRENSLTGDKEQIKILDTLISNKYMIEALNKSGLSIKNIDKYIALYNAKMSYFIQANLKLESNENKHKSIENFILCFAQCKAIELLKKKFTYKFLIPYIDNTQIIELDNELKKYKSEKDLILKDMRENVRKRSIENKS